MLQKIATPYHLKTLMELLLIANNDSKVKILVIFKNLFKVNIPAKIFNDAVTDEIDLSGFQSSTPDEFLLFNTNSESSFAKLLFTYAAFICNTDLLPKDERSVGLYTV